MKVNKTSPSATESPPPPPKSKKRDRYSVEGENGGLPGTKKVTLRPLPQLPTEEDRASILALAQKLASEAGNDDDADSFVLPPSLRPAKSKKRLGFGWEKVATFIAPEPPISPLPSSPKAETAESTPSSPSSSSSRNLYTSPQAEKSRPVMPPVGKPRRSLASSMPNFSNPQPIGTAPLVGATKNNFYNPENVYIVDGVPHTLVKQKGTLSCGSAALLMLYTDIVRHTKIPFSLEEEFWDWSAQQELANQDHLCNATQHTNLSAHQMGLGYTKLDQGPEKNILALEKQIASGMPVIVSITHPVLEGHWILLDAIKGDEVYIRDPHSGFAYKISKDLLKEYLSENLEFFLYPIQVEKDTVQPSPAAAE